MRLQQTREIPRLLYVENLLFSFLSARLDVARAAANHGFEVHVAVPLRDQNPAGLDSSLEWHHLDMGRDLSAIHEAKTIGALASLYRRLQPDLVHHIRTKAVAYGTLAARVVHIGAVANTLTGLGYVFHDDSVKAKLLRPALIQALRLASRHRNQLLIVQNSDDWAFCQKILCSPDRVQLIKGSGVDLEKFQPLPEPDGPVLVVLPARIVWDKGVKEFVAAAQALRASGLQARFAVIGSVDKDSPTPVDDATFEAWRESGAVEWWGWRDDIREVLAQAHIVCLPSYGEGAPRVLMEASACARAVVATDVPGCREVVKDGANGLLVPVKDAPALAAALKRVITDPELRSRLAGNGPRRMAEGFSRAGVIAGNLAVYRRLLGSAQCQRGPARVQASLRGEHTPDVP